MEVRHILCWRIWNLTISTYLFASRTLHTLHLANRTQVLKRRWLPKCWWLQTKWWLRQWMWDNIFFIFNIKTNANWQYKLTFRPFKRPTPFSYPLDNMRRWKGGCIHERGHERSVGRAENSRSRIQLWKWMVRARSTSAAADRHASNDGRGCWW